MGVNVEKCRCWIVQLYGRPSPTNARFDALKNPRESASASIMRPNELLSQSELKQVRKRCSGRHDRRSDFDSFWTASGSKSPSSARPESSFRVYRRSRKHSGS